MNSIEYEIKCIKKNMLYSKRDMSKGELKLLQIKGLIAIERLFNKNKIKTKTLLKILFEYLKTPSSIARDKAFNILLPTYFNKDVELLLKGELDNIEQTLNEFDLYKNNDLLIQINTSMFEDTQEFNKSMYYLLRLHKKNRIAKSGMIKTWILKSISTDIINNDLSLNFKDINGDREQYLLKYLRENKI